MQHLNGAWKVDLERSHFKGAAPADLAAKVQLIGEHLRVAMLFEQHDGVKHRSVLSCSTSEPDGSMEYNGKRVRGSAVWVDGELFFDWWMPAGGNEIHLCDWWTISSDGSTLTMEHRNDMFAGQHVVFTRLT
jgi:hypothetical protein